MRIDDLWALWVFCKREFAGNLRFDASSNIVYLLFTQNFDLHDIFSWNKRQKMTSLTELAWPNCETVSVEVVNRDEWRMDGGNNILQLFWPTVQQQSKVVYISSTFRLSAPESRDLSQAEKKNNCLLSWANSQNDNYLHSKLIESVYHFVNSCSLTNNYFYPSLR